MPPPMPERAKVRLVRLLRLAPLALLALMLAIAIGIEAIRDGAVLWLPKLPLAALLLWSLLRPSRAET